MSSITIKPYASVKGTGGANDETVGAIVTFGVKTASGAVPGTDFTVSWDNTDLSLSNSLSDDAHFYVDFGNNIPFKNNTSVAHALPITIDRCKGIRSLTSNYIFENATGGAVMIPTTGITLGNTTPAITGYNIGSSATIYTGVWTNTTFTNKNFFANPSSLNSNVLNVDLTKSSISGSSIPTSASTTYASGNRFKAEDSTVLADYTLYSVILPVKTTADSGELKFEDGSDPTKFLNNASVGFRLFSTVLQSIKITCGAPTLSDSTDGTNDQYINNNSSTLYCFATRYIQYNTQNTTYYSGTKISIEPGNKTVVLPSRALWNTSSISPSQANTGTYSAGITGTSTTGMVVLNNQNTSTLKPWFEGGRTGAYNTLDYSSSTCETYQIDGTGDYYWYATCMTTGASGAKKTLKQAISLNSVTFSAPMGGKFSHSDVDNTSGDYEVICLGYSGTSWTSSIPAAYAYNAALEGTIPNISGWVNECIYLF